MPPDTHSTPHPALDTSLALLVEPVDALMARDPLCVAADQSVQEVARQMAQRRSSAALVRQGDVLLGLVTEHDLSARVVAQGRPVNTPVAEVLTPIPHCVRRGVPAFEAMLLMARHGIHHVPVLDGNRPVGLITADDLLRAQQRSPLWLARSIDRQPGLPGLIEACAQVPLLQLDLVAADATAHHTGRLITAITDAVTVRLLALAERELGPPPLPYAWVAAGSQARQEQTARSDQDNALVLDDAYNPNRHGPYFEALARFVCDGLHACGYVHCPGDMMARNPQWRLTRREWAEHFDQWTRTPDPTALMLTSVFFDLRTVHGEAALVESLRGELLRGTRDNPLFLGHLVANALSRTPPLGWLGGLAPARSGEHKGTIDLKHLGVVPIVDLARVHALAGGHAEVNTLERLDTAVRGGALSEQNGRDLRETWEFLAVTRLRHQARQLRLGLGADSFLDPQELSPFERTQLKDAFEVVRTVQTLLGQRYRF